MNNRFDFYKDLYFKELEKVNEINNSLTTPIGLVTAAIAGCSYLLTSFDYEYSNCNTVFFIAFIGICIVFLIISIYHVIKAYSDFPFGYNYNIIADANDIDKYFLDLKDYYKNNPQLTDNAATEVEEYVLKEIINNTGTNQKIINGKINSGTTASII